jgi:exodeoxyribonuclease V alpha subunit
MVRRGDATSVVVPDAPGPRFVPAAQLDRIETWWAMTIHKSQGSEFPHAVVSLPADTSPILTRQLLYTAITRAKDRVTVVGGESAIRGAIERPIARASGLRHRLWPEA